MQPGIISEHRTRGEYSAYPAGWRLVDQVMNLEQFCVGLGGGLQRVAPVDKQRGAVAQHDRHTGRSGKAGKPGEPLPAWRDVLALMLVGARHDETVEALGCQFPTQTAEPSRAWQQFEILGREAVVIRLRLGRP